MEEKRRVGTKSKPCKGKNRGMEGVRKEGREVKREGKKSGD